MGKTISFVKGKGSLTHNNRDFIAQNVDKDRMDWNVYYIQQPLKTAYNELFGPAIEEYNSKQKRKDRLIKDYLTDIKNSGNKEKQFYETVVQIGRKEDTGVIDENGKLSVDAETARSILDEYVRSFQERNPNLYLFNAVLHMDEATPHLHLDYIPVAHGYKSKMHTRNSLTKALKEMGIEPATGKLDNETVHWQQRERAYLMDKCRDRGLEVEILGEKRDNYTIPEYKSARQAADELTAEIEILKAEKVEAEAMMESVNAEASEAAEIIETGKAQLAEIEEQIAAKEKAYKKHEKKIDMLLGAEKQVDTELSKIRQNVKELPARFGSEESVKIPMSDYNRLMDMAKASGTLSKLNELYERELNKLQGKVSKLRSQLKASKERISVLESFIDFKGLFEELTEFLKPKSVMEKLQKEKDKVANYKRKEPGSTEKKHDVAI